MPPSDQLTGGNIEPRGLEEEMKSSYLDYAMSVIVGRALPDPRDGLKPVHRRVLYAVQVTGSAGLAAGTATNIPPHNLRGTIAATIAFIDDPDIDVEGVAQHIKGPDFPTGGIILGVTGIREAYASGRGRLRVQARAHIE